MSSKTYQASDTCVIIGGGHAGQSTARELLKLKVPTIIVQSNAYTENPQMSPYHLIRPQLWKETAHTPKGNVANLETVGIEGVTYVVGTVAQIDNNELVLEDGRRLAFGTLVVAVGHHYPALMANTGEDFNTRFQFLEKFQRQLAAARSIVIGGGGPVAIEVAGTLRSANSTCKIQLVTSGPRALASWTGTPASVLATRLKKINVDIVSGARVVLPDDVPKGSGVYEKKNYALSNGAELQNVDIFLPFFGLAQTSFMPIDFVDESKGNSVRINGKGQSTQRDNIFAVGCGNQWSVNSAPTIDLEAKVVAANVRNGLNGASPSSDLPLQPPSTIDYVHVGLGEFSMLNLEQKGCFPGLLGRVCGCGCLPCFCCAFCGWCCQYPASECQGTCFKNVLLMGGNPHKVHKQQPPAMSDMVR